VTSGFQCVACGEWNVTTVDESVGPKQSYVEDCQVCCRANLLLIVYDPAQREFGITAELE
jgi:Cysteine-rich CPXCG